MKIQKIKTTEKIHNVLNQTANALIYAMGALVVDSVAGLGLVDSIPIEWKQYAVIAIAAFKFFAKMTEPKSVTP